MNYAPITSRYQLFLYLHDIETCMQNHEGQKDFAEQSSSFMSTLCSDMVYSYCCHEKVGLMYFFLFKFDPGAHNIWD